MLKIIVCIKQVPMVSELPWDSKTRTLKRDLAPGMMDPASRRALEAALSIKESQPAHIIVITMGPPMAEEILYQAIALGADRGVLLTDPKMAGADIVAIPSSDWRGIDPLHTKMAAFRANRFV